MELLGVIGLGQALVFGLFDGAVVIDKRLTQRLAQGRVLLQGAHRIGQDKPVFVYKLIARGSVEEKIQQLQQAKANLARGVLEGGSQTQLQLSEDDLQALFAPLSD